MRCCSTSGDRGRVTTPKLVPYAKERDRTVRSQSVTSAWSRSQRERAAFCRLPYYRRDAVSCRITVVA
eukprot:6922752-Prymnesium_polylepis.3